MLTQEEITALKHSSPERRSGIECTFLRINKKWGLKYWWDDIARDNNYLVQKLAHKLGVGPRVGTKIDFELDGNRLYGYITEAIVETAWDWMQFWRYNTGYSEYQKLERIVYDRMRDIVEKVEGETKCLQPCDLHLNNFGFDNDGNFVCIDFGGWYFRHHHELNEVSYVSNLEAKLNEHSIYV